MYEEEEEDVVIYNSDNNILGSVSSSPTRTTTLNPNVSFVTMKEEYGLIATGSDTLPPAKKKRYQRHTSSQIQEMEAFFKENPHPDDKQRTMLSEKLGLKPLKIKFWFQNKRTKIKLQQDKQENVMLREENKALKIENQNLMSDLSHLSCSSCGSSGDKLRLENYNLRLQLNMLESIASFMNPPLSLSQNTICFFPEANNNNDISIAEEDKASVMVLAVSCVQELIKMCETNEPLWNKKESLLCLNDEEYNKMFMCPLMEKDQFRREASRANGVVFMNSSTLVNSFLDADKWSELFCSIVSRAKMVQIISSGVSGASGSLILMYAELQVQTPLVSPREGYFLRYVEQNKEQGTWMIVDFPVDRFHGLIKPASSTTTEQYRRKPSGCIIQDMPDGYSHVTWVEHVEVEEKHVHHEMVREYIQTGAAFGADRWLAVLQRQCERMVSLMATNVTDLGVIPSLEARKNLMRLSQRMVRLFCRNISDSYRESLSRSTKDTVIVMSKKVRDGIVLCAVTTTLLPCSHLQVFDLLRDNHHHHSQEILFNGNSIQELAHIANGSHLGNCISLLRNNLELILQETCTDNSGSLVVYSTVNPNAVQLAMNGEDLSKIPLLPLGVSIVPVNPSEGIFANSPSCLLTVGIQVLTSKASAAKLDMSTVTAISNRLSSTVNQITAALGSSGLGN
ncbi:hypothetical protein AALP_AAs60861U000100 [Arabis alpina]|uniref:Uncharacterized protein n=1 Tax=Arabis alpina TaxID=50452 RepID=A0A087G0H2_ARAAL|nr:hypothetical protein AALP_AAs60861U000100 [Arabis alpina]